MPTTLAPTSESLLGRIIDEYTDRLNNGEHPDIEEYAKKHPELAEVIRQAGSVLQLARIPADSGPQEELAPHDQIGDYKLIREVGRGGMGIVYEAVQESLNRHVALKVLPTHSSAESNYLDRFHREARAAARLHHTNIVPVFEVGEHEGTHFYAMQFIRGQGLDRIVPALREFRKFRSTLTERRLSDDSSSIDGLLSDTLLQGLLKGSFAGPGLAADETLPHPDGRLDDTVPILKGNRPDSNGAPAAQDTGHKPQTPDAQPFPERQYYRRVAKLGIHVAEALGYAHRQGITHRDIKPSNLILDPQGILWITDFGLAKIEGEDLTKTGDFLGTVRYMAPERFAGVSSPGGDVYGLGMTLYEMLTFRPGFEETDQAQLIQSVTNREPPTPRAVDSNIPRDLESIILRAIAKEPARRYPSAVELADDLRRFHDGRPVLARPIGPLEKAQLWCQRNPTLAGLAAALLIVFALGFAGVTWQWQRAETNRIYAESSADKARRARDRTYDVLDDMTSQVAADWLGTQRELAPEQKKFLESAVDYFREFSEEEADDEQMQVRVAGAAHRLARIFNRLGQSQEAATAYIQARALASELASGSPDEGKYQFQLAEIIRHEAEVFQRLSRWDDALANLMESLSVLQGLVEQYPEEPEYLLRLASNEGDLGAHFRRQNDLKQSEAHHRRSVDTAEQLLAKFPEDRKHKRQLSASLNNLNNVLWNMQRIDEAEPVLLLSLKLKEELANDFPDEVGYQSDLALGYNNVGVLFQHTNRLDRAEEMFRNSLATYRRLTDRLPGVPEFRFNVGAQLQAVAAILSNKRKLPEALAQQERSVTALEALVGDFPDRMQYRFFMIEAHRMRGNLLRDLHQFEEAIDEYDFSIAEFENILAANSSLRRVRQQLYTALVDRALLNTWAGNYDSAHADWEKSIPLDPMPEIEFPILGRLLTDTWAGNSSEAIALAKSIADSDDAHYLRYYYAAAIFSVAARQSSSDSALEKTYANQAIAALQKSFKAGYKDLDNFLSLDKSFDPIRNRPEFQELVNGNTTARPN